jgi:hypothetical protein
MLLTDVFIVVLTISSPFIFLGFVFFACVSFVDWLDNEINPQTKKQRAKRKKKKAKK